MNTLLGCNDIQKRPHLRCSITRVQLHPELLCLLTQPANQVAQPHYVVTMVPHRQTFTEPLLKLEAEVTDALPYVTKDVFKFCILIID